MSDVYKVAITRLADGVTRVLSQPIRSGDTKELVLFYWGEGNMACDCNRDIYFQKAGGEEVDEGVVKCGDTMYSARIIDFGGMPGE